MTIDTIGHIVYGYGTEHNLDVIDGPSLNALEVATFRRKPKPSQVAFETDRGHTFNITINSVQPEDGSGESWNLTGVAHLVVAGRALQPPRKAKMYYRTDTRKGTLVFV